MARGRRPRRTSSLFQFDIPYRNQYGFIAGVDEAGRGPLAGPVVASAVILPPTCKLPNLNDSKLLSAAQRDVLFGLIQRAGLAIGIGMVEAAEIDRMNIRQASFAAMRQALSQMAIKPLHVLVDGFRIPQGPASQTGIIDGDAKSAHIAAASIIAKVTRDRIMENWDLLFPAYGFRKHKGYGTPEHLAALARFGPSPIHRLTYAPVHAAQERVSVLVRE